ncbi:MAG: cobalt ECF transporter T component CbiQ [Desulfobacteraceae bacterium]|nr:MAG: cobalt ECF transporter T component CbiQ [Desulfobacteraceae bacterium]
MEERFAEGDSVIHRTDPAVRALAATLYSFTVALMDSLEALGLALLFSIALAAAARLTIRPLVQRLAAAAGFLLLLWLLLPWSYPGEALGRLGPLVISRQGVRICLLVTCKTAAILIGFTALVATMHLSTLGHTLHRIGLPPKLVHLLLLAYRYIFVIQTEYQRLLRAAKIRNFRPVTTMHTYQTYAYLIGMLFVRASERSVRVHQAMKCRGFNGRFHSLDSFGATVWNPVLATAVVLVSAAMIYINIG